MKTLWKYEKFFLLAATLLGVLLAPVSQAERVKDIAAVAGIRINQLVGYGLVVGLDGTGDQTSQTPFTVQSIKSMLAQYGVTVPANVNPQLKNVAAVTVHADLPPFAKPGQQFDVTVSSIGNAKSLRGGALIMTPLRGADGQVYAIAQGNLIVGGLGVGGNDGSSITINIPSAGRVPNGATVERSVATQFASSPYLTLNLHTPDFTTATRLEQSINEAFKQDIAESIDAVSVRVKAPASMHDRVAFMSYIESLPVTPGDAAAKIVVNSRTGTVVIGSHVRVTAAAVAHGSLTVTITSDPLVSQPPAFSGGQTAVVPRSNISVEQGGNARMFKVPAVTTLDDVVRAVNQVGAAPGDLVAILEALKQAGALRAQIEVI